jgi:hypothetical protein
VEVTEMDNKVGLKDLFVINDVSEFLSLINSNLTVGGSGLNWTRVPSKVRSRFVCDPGASTICTTATWMSENKKGKSVGNASGMKYRQLYSSLIKAPLLAV